MRVVIFGLTVSSAWGNGHATLWRSLIGAMLGRGYQVTFFEKDVPYYCQERDLTELPHGGTLRLYQHFDDIRSDAQSALVNADLALCTSFCPDGRAASELILTSNARAKLFYDMDTPVTLAALTAGEQVPYIPARGLGDFDLVLSYTGGRALDELRSRLGARRIATLYGWVDPRSHFPSTPVPAYRNTLSYLGTYAADRQSALETLFLAPAAAKPQARFLIAGAQYPQISSWPSNVGFLHHLPPSAHPAFFASSRATLNITRSTMARYGFCPSGRLFEAAASGVPLLSDWFDGLDTFFHPGTELLSVRSAQDVLDALSLSDRELHAIAAAARARVLAEDTAERRVTELEVICNSLHTTQTNAHAA